MSLAFGLALPHWQAISGGAFSPASLFAGGTVAGAWYDPSDLTTLFTTSAGTTPVAMPGQGSAVSVGLMLDKSTPVAATGYYSAFIGASTGRLELGGQSAFAFGTGDFTVETWIYGTPANGSMLWDFRPVGGLANTATLYYVSNQTRLFVNGVDQITGGALTAGVWNHVAIARSGTSTKLFINGSQSGSTYTDTTNYVVGANRPAIGFNGSSPGSVVNTYMSNFRVVKGAAVYTRNFTPSTAPLTAISGTSLLTLQNNYFKDNSGNGFGVTPTGDVSVNLLNPFDATAARTINNAIALNNTTARPELRARVNLLVATATLSTQNVTTQATSYTLSFAGTGSITLSGTATGSYSAGTHTITCTAGTLTLTVSGTVTTADLRPANSGALLPAYQAVVDANTYDTSGFPLYLRFDGIDDSMYTPANVNLSGTDKATVFAGVRKLSDAALFIAELSANTTLNNGSFGLYQSGATVLYGQRGTIFVDEPSAASYAAPTSVVVTGVGNISGDATTIRTNGIEVTDTSDLGAGNFGTYPLYIGARNNSSLWFNGHLYSLAVVGSAVSGGNIAAMESWVAGRTGIAI